MTSVMGKSGFFAGREVSSVVEILEKVAQGKENVDSVLALLKNQGDLDRPDTLSKFVSHIG